MTKRVLSSAVFDAVRADNVAAIAELIAMEPNVVYERGLYGSTLLIHACAHGRTQIGHLLLDAGADVNASNLRGRTALMEAARAGNECLVTVLLARGASLTAVDADGLDALGEASAAGHDRCVDAMVPYLDATQLRDSLHFSAAEYEATLSHDAMSPVDLSSPAQ